MRWRLLALAALAVLAAGAAAVLVRSGGVAPGQAAPERGTQRAEAAGRRVALVIGNDAYAQIGPLLKAVSDARAMATTLAELGFEVIRRENLGRREMNAAIGEFAARLGPGGAGVFFFAGHGVQLGGTNYLLPVDLPRPAASRQGEAEVRDEVRDEAVALDRLLERLGEAQARFMLAIIDACRNNPFPRAAGRALGGERGLTVQTAPPRGVFIVFSAGQNQTALDGLSDADPEPNSVFTRTFLPLMRQPGLRIDDAVRQARQQVRALAAGVQHEQDPAFYDQTDGDFYFVPAAAAPVAAPAVPAPATPAVPAASDPVDLAFWQSIQASTHPADFEDYLTQPWLGV